MPAWQKRQPRMQPRWISQHYPGPGQPSDREPPEPPDRKQNQSPEPAAFPLSLALPGRGAGNQPGYRPHGRPLCTGRERKFPGSPPLFSENPAAAACFPVFQIRVKERVIHHFSLTDIKKIKKIRQRFRIIGTGPASDNQWIRRCPFPRHAAGFRQDPESAEHWCNTFHTGA